MTCPGAETKSDPVSLPGHDQIDLHTSAALSDQFSAALQNGHKAEAEAIMASSDFDPDARNGAALREAIQLGYLDIAETLIARSRSLNARGEGGITALFIALENEYFDIAEMLLKHGAEISVRDERGWTPLIWAAIKGYPRVVEFLLKSGADLHICSNDGWNALTGAFFKQHKKVVDLLTQGGATFGRKYKEAALLSAFDYGAYDIVHHLIQDGVNVNIGSSDGRPLLISVLQRGEESVFKLLLDADADVNIRDINGNAALLSAILANQYSLAGFLIQKGAAVNVKGPKWAPIHIAANKGQVELCRSLLEAGAAVDQLGHSGKTALMLAAEQRHLQTVSLLLENGADPNLKDEKGKSCREFAGYHSSFREQNSVVLLLDEWSARS